MENNLESGTQPMPSVSDYTNVSSFGLQLTEIKQVTLQWEHIEAVVFPNETKYFRKDIQDAPHQILRDVNGFASPGEILAILGNSGSGKTTLLNILAGRKQSKLLVTGSVKVSGEDITPPFNKFISHVQQEDFFIGTLTVNEHLTFQANLRLESKFSAIQKTRRVKQVLNELGLNKCSNTLIGVPGRLKGASGGERKRLAFASELLTNPSLLICDEPISGLDSFNACNVVNVLHRLAAKGRTIVCTIHQPSSEIYESFRNICLLADGQVAFLGTSSQALDFFLSIDLVCPKNYNPADFYIKKLSLSDLNTRENIEDICQMYEESMYAKVVTDTIQVSDQNSSSIEPKEEKFNYQTSWFSQLMILTKRQCIITKREPFITALRFMECIVLAILLMIVYWGQHMDQKGVMNIKGIFFLMITNMTLQSTMAIICTFSNEIPVFQKEYAAGLYRIETYFLAKTLAELPVFIMIPIIFTSIVYFSVGLRHNTGAFFVCLSVMILIVNVGCSFGYAVSCLSSNTMIALAILSPIYIPIILFGGHFLHIDSIPVSLRWIKYLSWFYFGYEILSINQWAKIDKIECEAAKPICFLQGADVLKQLNFKKDNITFDFTMLIVLVAGYRIIAYIILSVRIRYFGD